MEWKSTLRYSRQIILSGFGEQAQKKLFQSSVLVIGAGGIGSPALLYLASMGVGKLGVIDDDRVEISNLHRQIIHETNDVGEMKVFSAKQALEDLNPEILIETYAAKFTSENAEELINNFDVILDGSDNIATRYLCADICHKLKKPLISAAIHQYEGMVATFKPYLGEPHPSYRCLFPSPPPPEAMPKCSEAGILGSVGGTIGSLAATEIIKEITGVGESLSGHIIFYDALKSRFRKVKLSRDIV